MNVILTVLLTLLMFGIIIFAHEFGPLAIGAKKCHIYVEEFSVGMGPKLFAFHKERPSILCVFFPIGGYCENAGGRWRK